MCIFSKYKFYIFQLLNMHPSCPFRKQNRYHHFAHGKTETSTHYMTCQACQGNPMSEIRQEHDCFIFSSDAKCQAFLFNLFYCNLAMIVSLTGEIRSSNWMSLSDLTVTLLHLFYTKIVPGMEFLPALDKSVDYKMS